MSTAGISWIVPSTFGTPGMEGSGFEPIAPSKRGKARPSLTRRGPTRRWSRDASTETAKALASAPVDGGPTHTITCSCCEETVTVPLRRRFLCDACFHESRG
jgi:hypothetical protein